MSDLLIRGMQMPTNCLDCKLCYDAFYCKALGIGFYVDRDKEYRQEGFEPETERLQGCPLIHVPPHGRLIDADRVSLEGGPYEYDEWCKWALDQYQDAPTIIPAEEGET